jgi:hypothetical protein
MAGGNLQNPAGAFGAPVLTGFDPSNATAYGSMRAAVSTITAGDVVAYSSSVGYVIRALTNTAANLIAGVALEAATSTVGNPIMVATGGWVKANKGTAAITAGNYVTAETTTTGAVAAVTQATAVTQVKDVQGLIGVCMVSATAGDTTCNVWLGGTVG